MKAFSQQPVDTGAFIRAVQEADLPLEYMWNSGRLSQELSLQQFENATGLDRKAIAKTIHMAVHRGLLIEAPSGYRVSETGRLFLDDLVQLFLPDDRQEVA